MNVISFQAVVCIKSGIRDELVRNAPRLVVAKSFARTAPEAFRI
jgi:hypothetical protein